MSNGNCFGYIVSDGKTLSLENRSNASNVSLPNHCVASFNSDCMSFGILDNGLFVIGYGLNPARTNLRFRQLISAGPWLVRDGRVHPSIGKGGEIAPRTTIGFDRAGNLLIVQFDGAEVQRLGTTVWQSARMLVELGLVQAMNLDGGGSSVSWSSTHGIVDRPTCTDTETKICERAVTTITCLK